LPLVPSATSSYDFSTWTTMQRTYAADICSGHMQHSRVHIDVPLNHPHYSSTSLGNHATVKRNDFVRQIPRLDHPEYGFRHLIWCAETAHRDLCRIVRTCSPVVVKRFVVSLRNVIEKLTYSSIVPHCCQVASLSGR
jgi:hypothetical protein